MMPVDLAALAVGAAREVVRGGVQALVVWGSCAAQPSGDICPAPLAIPACPRCPDLDLKPVLRSPGELQVPLSFVALLAAGAVGLFLAGFAVWRRSLQIEFIAAPVAHNVGAIRVVREAAPPW